MTSKRQRLSKKQYLTPLIAALPTPALASDFGCAGEWLSLGMGTAPVWAMGWAVAAAWMSARTHRVGAVGAVVLGAFLVAATPCTYGNDADGFALGMLGVALIIALTGGRMVRALQAARQADGAATPEPRA